MNSWDKFLNKLDDLLCEDGWYVQTERIRKRKLTTYKQVVNYLHKHCYEKEKAEEIVYRAGK